MTQSSKWLGTENALPSGLPEVWFVRCARLKLSPLGMSYFLPGTRVEYKSAHFDSATAGDLRVTGNFFTGHSATSLASTWTPASIPDGWWLDSQYDVAANVSTWGSRGTLLPELKARDLSTMTVDANGVLFASGAADFLYETSLAPHSNEITIFCVYRTGAIAVSDLALLGKYKTSTNERTWQLVHTTGHTLQFAASANGSAATTVSVSPVGSPRYRFHTVIVRKTGPSLDAWFDGVKVTSNAVVPATMFTSPLPLTIGGRGGTASSDGTVGFKGHIRHVGLYNSALSDSDVAKLLEWQLREARWFVGADSFGTTAASYLPATIIRNSLVVTPNGLTPARTEPATHRYRHHVAIGKLSTSPRIWVSHSSGAVNEDSSGQQLHVEYSDDDGATWSSPLVAAGSIPGGAVLFGGNSYESNIAICFSRGFYQYKGKLYVTIAVDRKQAGPPYSSSTLRGAAQLARECCSDGTLGTVFRIDTSGEAFDSAPPYDTVLGPPLLALTNQYGIWGGNGPEVTMPTATWNGWTVLDGETSTTLTEPTTASLDGSAENLIRLWRCVAGPQQYVLWMSRSWDGGVTWNHPTPTSVPNAPSSSCLLRLTDGRHALVFNSGDIAGKVRGKLSLMLFDADGRAKAAYVVYDAEGTAVQYAGTFKTGAAAYPGMIQDGDALHIAFSLWKESVRYVKVKLPRW